MVERIEWALSDVGGFRSPFVRGENERPISLTLHSSSFNNNDISRYEEEAIEALYELANLPEIELFEIKEGNLPNIDVGDIDEDIDPENLIVAQIHQELNHDILVTLSNQLLDHKKEGFVRIANPRTPLEATRLVGLFLRSRNNYTLWAGERSRHSKGRGAFYWILCRDKLPGMWRYFSACVDSAKSREDDILYLGQSVLNCSARALQARDEIGFQFYIPQNNDTRDAIIYHFNYLTLLLTGTFDAQARVAHRTYGIKGLTERNSDFRRKKFQNLLLQNGGKFLHEIISSEHFTHLMVLLYELRNTIHGADLPTTAYVQGGKDEASFIRLLPEYSDIIWDAANWLKDPGQWGIRTLHSDTIFEPYSYSSKLVDECLKAIDLIASATDVERLFPAGTPVPELQNKPPENGWFSEKTRRRVFVLG